jgi:hypothetical protein
MAKTIMFNPLGGALTARSEAGEGASGSYRLMIFERDGFTIVPPSPIKGQFKVGGDTDDPLDGPATDYDGRFIQMLASVGVFEPERAYALHLTITQDGNDLDHEDDVGTDEGDGQTHESDKIIVHLVAKPPQAAMNARNSASVSLLDSLKAEVLEQLVDTVAAKLPASRDVPNAKDTAKKKGGNS